MHNMGSPAADLAVFAVLAPNYQPSASCFSAEMLERRQFAQRKNSEGLAVPSLFFAVPVQVRSAKRHWRQNVAPVDT